MGRASEEFDSGKALIGAAFKPWALAFGTKLIGCGYSPVAMAVAVALAGEGRALVSTAPVNVGSPLRFSFPGSLMVWET